MEPQLTVSCCVAEVRPVAEAVTVGVPASVSLYLKLTVLVRAGIITVVIVAVSAVFRKRPTADVEVRLTVWPPLPASTGLPEASSSCTEIVPEGHPRRERLRGGGEDQLAGRRHGVDGGQVAGRGVAWAGLPQKETAAPLATVDGALLATPTVTINGG